MRRVSMTVCLLSLFVLWASQAMAAERGTFVVLPFSIQGPAEFSHLEKAIPQMLTSRLYWKGQVEQAREVPASQKAVSTEQEAEKARAAYRADYVVWGTVTIMGNNFSLDVRVRSKAGKTWAQSREGNTNQIIGSVSSVSDALNREIFGRRTQAAASSTGRGPERVNQMNPGLVVNEDRPKDVYLNPQFRYSGSSAEDDSRMRSQALPFNSIGMEVCDADGDGRNEILILGSNTLYAYRFEGTKLAPIGEFALPMTNEALSIRSMKRPSGKTWIIVNQVDKKLVPATSVFTFDGSQFKEEMRNIKYFLNVVKLPPHYNPTLIGQQTQPPQLFRPGVYEMVVMNGQLTTGARLSVPNAANVMNFTYVPGTVGEDGGDKVIVLNQSEKLTTYTSKGSRIAETEDSFSGSAVGMEIPTNMPGLGRDTVTIPGQYYIPMRMLPIDLERDGRYELLVNKPISTASKIFDRYRFFPQSEIHCLFWDGIGLNLQWKTRRIKGSTVDYAVTDANNDGIQDLVVCLNTHPGAIGVQARRTIIMLYPLDTAQTDPNTPAYNGDFYE